ncbi:hypothetical protein Tco_0928682 [Tanacetum coccineum]
MRFFMEKIREVLDKCNDVGTELAVTTTNKILKAELPRLVALAVKKDQEIAFINVPELVTKEFATHAPKMIEKLFKQHMQNTTLNFYPTTSTSTATTSIADLLHQLYLTMKANTQYQTTNLEINSKIEKRVMLLVEIVKFCDATMKRVLNEDGLRIFKIKFWKKPPLPSALDFDILKAFRREINKRLRHREQMRRWESFVNGRPILPTMKRLQ